MSSVIGQQMTKEESKAHLMNHIAENGRGNFGKNPDKTSTEDMIQREHS
jgi:hypothetical protein